MEVNSNNTESLLTNQCLVSFQRNGILSHNNKSRPLSSKKMNVTDKSKSDLQVQLQDLIYEDENESLSDLGIHEDNDDYDDDIFEQPIQQQMEQFKKAHPS